MAASCFAPWCGIDGHYGNPGVCNAPGGHKYKPPVEEEAVAEKERERGVCENCGRRITILIFKNERYCSDDCRKALEDRDAQADRQHS